MAGTHRVPIEYLKAQGVLTRDKGSGRLCPEFRPALTFYLGPYCPQLRPYRRRASPVAGEGSALTAKARASFLAGFERQVDPALQLPEAERARRAVAARKAYFALLAYRSARARARGVGP